MARFYASIQGNRGEATRVGTPASGISGHIRGWNIGARIEMECGNNLQGELVDRVYVYLTTGSTAQKPDKLIWSGTRADFDALIGERAKEE